MSTVIIGLAAAVVTDNEFDFHISIQDNDCLDATNCIASSTALASNTAKGFHCDAYVADISDSTCTYDTAGDYLPCKKWNNFYDSSKADEYQFSLSMTGSDNALVVGSYSIKYNCYWLMPGGTTMASDTETGVKTLHEFEVEEGCSEWSNLASVPLEKLFLLSSPDFLAIIDCDIVECFFHVFCIRQVHEVF